MTEGERDSTTVIVDRRGAGLLAFLCGVVVGAGVALLYAPKSGAETQADLREGARRLREGAEEKLTHLRGSLEDQYGRTREGVGERISAIGEDVRDRQAKAGQALKAGKDAARLARSDLEARVAESKAAYRAAVAGDSTDEASEDAAPDGDAGEEEATPEAAE